MKIAYVRSKRSKYRLNCSSIKDISLFSQEVIILLWGLENKNCIFLFHWARDQIVMNSVLWYQLVQIPRLFTSILSSPSPHSPGGPRMHSTALRLAELPCEVLLCRVWLCATPQMAAHQAPPSLGFSRQEHWSGLPFPSPIHEREKGKWLDS